MTNKTRKWIRAGAESFITGATSGVGAPVATSIIDPKDWGVSWHSLQLFCAMFFGMGAIRFMHWWQTNPLPPEDDSAPPILGASPTPVMPMSPLAKVTPIVSQPPVDPPKP